MQALSKKQLKKMVEVLSWNDGYGCYTRAGFEKMVWPSIAEKAQFIIFFDIDDMHALNARHGYEGVNAIIRKSLKLRGTDFMAGQWFSGDEFIIVITDDANDRGASNPIGFCARLADIFRENGASATFVIAPVRSGNLQANVEPAHKICQQNKRNDQRGGISVIPGKPR